VDKQACFKAAPIIAKSPSIVARTLAKIPDPGKGKN